MSRTAFERNVVSLLEALQANVEGKRFAYTETFVFPALDLGAGEDPVWESDPTYRAKVLSISVNELSEAIANNPTLQIGVGGGDTDAYVKALTYTATAVRTGADDSDAATDFERIMLPGVERIIPASQLVTGTGTDPGTGTGIGTLYVVVGYFE